ncbi:MAG: hypothetical protein FWG42_08830 [Clostridiales bacterium]|nr:hypothetical protein [Clostridiales bacterium]
MKKIIITAMLVSVFLCCTEAAAAKSQVSVTIPAFSITINEQTLDHRSDRYPFICYKGITYFPMTYDHCSYLGVATAWTAKDGLYVAAKGYMSGELPNYGKANNSASSYTASVADFPIHVNGKLIDNSKEEFPVLLFRDVTYFPMTWRFATEELSWKTSWDGGLTVSMEHRNNFYFDSVGSESADLVRFGEKNYYARLNYADDSFTPLATPPNNEYQGQGKRADVRLQGNSLYYEGAPIADITDIVTTDAQSNYGSASGHQIYVSGTRVDFSGGFYLTVRVDYEMGIPAPYTPKKYFHFAAFDGANLKQLDIGEDEQFERVHSVQGGIYVSTHYSVSRHGFGYSTLRHVSKGGVVVNVNDKFDDFGSMHLLGTVGDAAYLICHWSPHLGRVSLINDGYYKMGRDYSLTKIYPYIATNGEILAPNGNLYALPQWKDGILNLTKGTFIDLSSMPVAKVEHRE